MRKDCTDCIYHSKEGVMEGGFGNVVQCEYPMPAALTHGSMFCDKSAGSMCPLLTTKEDIANRAMNSSITTHIGTVSGMEG